MKRCRLYRTYNFDPSLFSLVVRPAVGTGTGIEGGRAMVDECKRATFRHDRFGSHFISPRASTNDVSEQPPKCPPFNRSKSILRSSRRNTKPERRSIPPWRASVKQGKKDKNIKTRYTKSDRRGCNVEGKTSCETDGISRAGAGTSNPRGTDVSGPVGDAPDGNGVVTIEMIIAECCKSPIKPSAVSTPTDFLTSEIEYRRVWQVGRVEAFMKSRMHGD